MTTGPGHRAEAEAGTETRTETRTESRPVRAGDALPPLEIVITRTLVVAGAIASRDYQDVHHDAEAARQKGSPDIFMNILTTNGLVGRYITDHFGPAAVLRGVTIRLGAPNHPGDRMTLTGVVEDVRGDAATVRVVGANSLGTHVTGTVTVTVPGPTTTGPSAIAAAEKDPAPAVEKEPAPETDPVQQTEPAPETDIIPERGITAEAGSAGRQVSGAAPPRAESRHPQAQNPQAGNPRAGNGGSGNPAAGNVGPGNPEAGNVAAGNPRAGNPEAGKAEAGSLGVRDPEVRA